MAVEIWTAIAASATMGAMWLGVRKDARDTKADITESIQNPLISSLNDLKASIENLRHDQRADTEKLEKRLLSVEESLRKR